jgi:flagellar hook-associated protein 1 FlgK
MDVKDDTSLFKEGKLADFIIGISLELGIDARQAKSFMESYTDITVAVDNQRKSVMDVDLEEETVNMLLFQQMFAASSKLINIINEIYDTLINQVRA